MSQVGIMILTSSRYVMNKKQPGIGIASHGAAAVEELLSSETKTSVLSSSDWEIAQRYSQLCDDLVGGHHDDDDEDRCSDSFGDIHDNDNDTNSYLSVCDDDEHLLSSPADGFTQDRDSMADVFRASTLSGGGNSALSHCSVYTAEHVGDDDVVANEMATQALLGQRATSGELAPSSADESTPQSRFSISSYHIGMYKLAPSGFTYLDDPKLSNSMLRIHDIEPILQARMSMSYISYKLTISAELSQSQGAEKDKEQLCIFRRYRHFHWLYTELAYRYPGTIVPGIPSKNFRNRLNPSFVQQRMKGLCKFLLRIAAHPVLSKSQLFAKFISYDEINLHYLIEANESQKSLLMVKMRIWVEKAVLRARLPYQALPVKLGVLSLFDRTRKDMLDLENLSRNLNQCSSARIHYQRELASATLQIGKTLAQFCQFKMPSNGVPLALQLIQEVCDRHSELLKEENANSFSEVVSPFNERMHLIRSMKHASCVVLSKELQYVIAMRRHHNPTFDSASFNLVHDDDFREFDMFMGEMICENALEEWNMACQTFLKDYKAKTKQMNDDLLESIMNLAVSEANKHKKSLNLWEEALECLQELDMHFSEELTQGSKNEFHINVGNEDVYQRQTFFEIHEKDQSL